MSENLTRNLRPAVFEMERLTHKVIAVFVGTFVLALASQIAVPMVPVPITMQTFVVTMIGALYGWRMGVLTVLAWLGEAAMGLPVLANGTGGMAVFIGPTAGYLFAFPLMAALVGFVTERFVSTDRIIATSLLHFSANILCLVIGSLWLSNLIGIEKAFVAGFVPFVLGAILKSVLAAACLAAVASRLKRKA